MGRPPMTTRAIRVPDKLWQAALAAADERDEVLSEEIRAFLERYVKQATTKERAVGSATPCATS